MNELYDVIFKRKSIRKFDETLLLTEEELAEIEQQTEKIIPLVENIKVKIERTKRTNTTAKYGEYCLLLYSEKNPFYLLNAGYLLEQMDLFLSAKEIGVCWYGMAKTKVKQVDGLEYVIMLAFGKSHPEDFRKNGLGFNRKSKEEIWKGEFDADVIEAVRLAPSACNTQSWRFESDSKSIHVFRTKKIKSLIPAVFLSYYNRIDLGIALCFLELALTKKGFSFDRTLLTEETEDQVVDPSRLSILL